MPRLRNNLHESKEDLAHYFQNLAHGIQTTCLQFKGVDELINFALLDIVTALFHSKPEINQSRFIDNLESILTGIKKYHEQEKSNAANEG